MVTVQGSPFIITVDGPSGAGKGTVCRKIANNLGYSLLDSGAMYRLAALGCIQQQVDLSDERAVVQVAKNLDICFEAQTETTVIRLDGHDVSQAIREEQVGMAASVIAAYPDVRTQLLQQQRDFAQFKDSAKNASKDLGLVADGRDMGTVVFPTAQVKIFLTASAQERARRRVLQLESSGVQAIDYGVILKDIQDRDERDSSRATAPLKPAVDAYELDSTELSIDDVCKTIMDRIALVSNEF